MIKLMKKGLSKKLSEPLKNQICNQINSSPDFITFLRQYIDEEKRIIDGKLDSPKLLDGPNYSIAVAGYLTTRRCLQRILESLEDITHDQ